MTQSRLKSARKAAGITLEELAADVSISVSQLSRAERGQRRLRVDEIERIASRLDMLPSELLDGAGSGGKNNVFPIVGYCGLGEDVQMTDTFSENEFDKIELPFGFSMAGCAAIICRGHAMAPRVRSGEIVIYHRDDYAPSSLVGREVVACTEDGRVLMKVLEKGNRTGVWDLASHNFPTIKSVRIAWLGKVLAIVPAGMWKDLR